MRENSLEDRTLWQTTRLFVNGGGFLQHGTGSDLSRGLLVYVAADWLSLEAVFEQVAGRPRRLVHGTQLVTRPRKGGGKTVNIDELKRKLGIADPGSWRIDPETGVVQKRGPWGWENTSFRVDRASGKVQQERKGLFGGWEDTGVCVDPESGVIQTKDTWFGYQDEDIKDQPRNRHHQKRTWLGWEDTNERIDPKTGKLQVRTWFGWADKK